MPSYNKLPYPEIPLPTTAPTVVTNNTIIKPQKHSSPFAGWTLLPLRLFLAITFVYAGMQKLTDPQFFHKSTPGYIGNQLIALAHGSPLHDLLIKMIPHAVLFGYVVALGEIAIGLGVLFGLLFRPAAFFGLLLSVIFFLSASWHVYPYFYGSDIVFAFCWLTMLLHGPATTGYPALDTWLTKTLLPQTSGLASFVRALLIGSPDTPQIQNEDNITLDTHPSARQGNTQQRTRAIMQKKHEARRNFLLGTITGTSAIVSLGLIGFVLNALSSNGQNTTQSTTQTNTSSNDTTPNGGAPTDPTTGAGTVIAQVSAVARNASTTFTIPSTGDPGVLIHLPNDQFVAYDATCTHAGCQVDYDPPSQHLICPCHGATFDPAQQAAVLDGPAPTPLTGIAIRVDSATGAITLE